LYIVSFATRADGGGAPSNFRWQVYFLRKLLSGATARGSPALAHWAEQYYSAQNFVRVWSNPYASTATFSYYKECDQRSVEIEEYWRDLAC
jgi:hypothetical protein